MPVAILYSIIIILMKLLTYYSQNYAGIIGASLLEFYKGVMHDYRIFEVIVLLEYFNFHTNMQLLNIKQNKSYIMNHNSGSQ